MKILLDENLPRKLITAVRAEGHDAESVHTLKLAGLDNGRLYSFAIQNFDICFTKDFGFANNVRQGSHPPNFKLLHVRLPQAPQDKYVADFIAALQQQGFENYAHGDEWP